MEQKSMELSPDPKRVIEGLRDTGYQFESSIADIVDNAIAAQATVVRVSIERQVDGEIIVAIADNGHGMNFDELINAMKYGSTPSSSALSLGKFGLGLKTASTAFCRKLSVITKSNKSAEYLKATWDLDHVCREGKWALLLSNPSVEEVNLLKKVAGDQSGTVVVWENVDRLLRNYADPAGKRAQVAFEKAIERLTERLELIYQRFLDPTYPNTPKVSLFINDHKLEPWNPFVPEESEIVGQQKVAISRGDGGPIIGYINLTAYVLPRKEDFNSADLAKKAHISNDYQGIYVYRENRLIYGPDWFNIFIKDPHVSLLRIDFSFDHELDEAFQIDIKKSQVIISETLRDWLKNTFLPSPRRAAEQNARIGLRKLIAEQAKSIHVSSNKAIASKADEVTESKLETTDEGKVQVKNKEGTATLVIKVSEPANPEEIYVKPVDFIEDGLLWEPTVMNNKLAVSINTAHEYYSKVYIPNKNSTVIIQGLDSLLWALAEAEMETVNEQNQRYFLEMRYQLSKILRILARELPEPEI